MPMIQAGLSTVISTPARAGPNTMAAEALELTRALAASRRSGARREASRVYLPALPQACSREEAASSTTYSQGVSTPRTQARGTQASMAARSAASANSSRRAGKARIHRPRTSAPTAPGSA